MTKKPEVDAKGKEDKWNNAFNGKFVRTTSYQDGPQVIGAGLPRTGTSSTEDALEILLGHPGYHMRNVIGEDKVDFWRAMNQGNVSKEEIREHFKEYASVQDCPAIIYWEKILEAYPDAKVLMTTRKFDGWYSSIHNSIIVGWPGLPERWWGWYFISILSPFWRRWTEMMRVGWV